jgi:tight adherence protein B
MRRPPPPLTEVATVAQRLAVLLAAGVAPASAWRHVAEGSPSAVPAAVVAGGRVDTSILDAVADLPRLESDGWRGLAASWSLATDSGTPLAPSLTDYAASLRSLAQAQREVQVALAGPVATARMVMALPVVGVLFGLVLGFNTLATLFATGPGWVCLVIGGALMLAAARWNRRLVQSAQPTHASPGLEFDLMAIAVAGGGSLDQARAALDRAVVRFDLQARPERVDSVLTLSRRAGVPAADLLRAEAQEARREARAEAQEKAATLSVRLMLPLGLCVLPAFMVLGVLPLMISVISTTVSGF